VQQSGIQCGRERNGRSGNNQGVCVCACACACVCVCACACVRDGPKSFSFRAARGRVRRLRRGRPGSPTASHSSASVLPLAPPPAPPPPAPLSHGGGGSEVGEELEAQAHHEVPDVAGHLGAGDEDAPEEHHQDGVEGVADVPQPAEHKHNGVQASTSFGSFYWFLGGICICYSLTRK